MPPAAPAEAGAMQWGMQRRIEEESAVGAIVSTSCVPSFELGNRMLEIGLKEGGAARISAA